MAYDLDKLKHRSFQDYAAEATKLGLSVLHNGPVTFDGNLHDPDLTAHQLANAAMVLMFDVSALSPSDLRDKILAVQDEMRGILVHSHGQAMRMERQRIGLLLEASGHSVAASLIR